MATSKDPYSRLEYRRLIAWPQRIQREWPLLAEVLAGPPEPTGPPKRVLDLGCGTGEQARCLAEQGFEGVGVDASASMIEKAREEPVAPEGRPATRAKGCPAARLAPEGRPATRPAGLSFVHGDVAELESLTEGRFDGGICLGNTLPHIRTDQALGSFLRGLRRRLAPGASWILQLLNYERIVTRGERHLPLNFRPHEGGESVFLRLMQTCDDGRVLFFPTTLKFRPDEDPPVSVAASKRVELRGWRLAELEAAFDDAGFAERRLYGSFEMTPFEPEESRDLILISK